MELISKVSKGSKMDQIYIPKNRVGFDIGNYVIIKPLTEKKLLGNLYFYGIKLIEPIKLGLVREVMGVIESNIEKYENIIVTGSFLDEGFQFNDIDIIIISEYNANMSRINREVEKRTGIKVHILILDNKTFTIGLKTDPLYQMMLSKCIAKKRFVYKTEHKLDYKMLDLHLLKSKILMDNFDVLSGNEKYDLVRNMMAIYLYLGKEKVNKAMVDNEIKKNFRLADISQLKQNLIDKNLFLKRYRLIYSEAFAKILKGIEIGAK